MRRYTVINLCYPNDIHPLERKLIVLHSLTKLEISKFDNEDKMSNEKVCELALAFIVNKPKGNLSEQIEFLLHNFYAGWLIEIIRQGYILSGLEFELCNA